MPSSQDDTTPVRLKPVRLAVQPIDIKPDLRLSPLARGARNRVVELAIQGHEPRVIAQRACVKVDRVREIIRSELEIANRLRARLRIQWNHESMMAIERIIAAVEADCYDELEVAS